MRCEQLAEGVTLYHGDCRDVIGELRADAVITDPPYEEHMHAAKGRKRTRKLRTDGQPDPAALAFDAIGQLRADVTGPLVKACSGWLLAFCTPEGVAAWRDAIEAAGARYKRACHWVKPDAAPQFNGQGPAMGAEMFVAAWCGRGHSRWNGGGRSNVFEHMTHSRGERWHETQKPVPLMIDLVDLFSDPGDVVLDPFMGAGTTGVAAVRRGRRFYGIEQDAACFDIARRRVAETLKQVDLFVAVPKLKQSALTFST